MAAETKPPHFALFIALTWLAIAVQLLAAGWFDTAHTLGDTDDALRLVQVRNFLAGQGWFDLHEARLGPPLGYDSHWSRLIDAGLAGLFVALHFFMNAQWAERLMRVVWPLLWLLPAIGASAALAWRMRGRAAAQVLLLLLVVGLPAFSKFYPGRIDHHNVQIALALCALALAAWCDIKRWAGAALGALIGLALAIGLESLPFLVVAGAVPALHYVSDRTYAPRLRDFGLALAAAVCAAFLVSVAPSNWNRTVCDTMAVNWMLPVAAAGLLLAATGRFFSPNRLSLRAAAIGGIALVGGAIWLALDPRCIGGPFAEMDPALRPIWLAYVAEIQPLATVVLQMPAMAAKIIAFPAAALVALVALATDGHTRRNPAYLATGAAFILAAAITAEAARMHAYALWMGLPLVAAWLLAVFARFRMTTLVARAFTILLLAPATLSVGAIAAVKAATRGETGLETEVRNQLGCFDSVNYAQIARLPKGVIATDIDYGPFVLALTPHSVLAGPYHRLAAGIMASHQVFALPPEAAREVVARNRVTYLVTCGGYILVGATAQERAASLWTQLAAGDPPDWLEKMPAVDTEPFTVYRVKARGL